MSQKSIIKRIRITKTGKLIRRKMAQDHFRAKKSGRQIQTKRKGLSLSTAHVKLFKNYSW